ncbi:MAG: CHAT domain-containing protein [Methylococcales bacterium]
MNYLSILPRLVLIGFLVGIWGLNSVAGSLENSVQANNHANASKPVEDAIQDLIEQGETYRTKGHLIEAGNRFRQALELAKQSGNAKNESLATGLYGYILFLQQDYAQAKALLQSALAQAKAEGLQLLAAIHSNHLGNYYSARKQWAEAQSAYSDALKSAELGKDTALMVSIQINQIKLDAKHNPTAAWKHLMRIKQPLTAVEPIIERIHMLLAAGYQATTIIDYQATNQSQRIEFASQLLNEGLLLARQINHARYQSLALGHLGKMDEGRRLYAQALQLTDAAVNVLPGFGDDDFLIQLQWQRGRLLKALGDNSAALIAYRRAVNHIEAVRGDIPVDYQDGRSSFRETLQPVYLGLADLLIQQSDLSEDRETAQRLLKNARTTVELIKKTELEDYFNNRCNIQSLPEAEIESIAPRTAALYPIILDDRLELLISLPDGIFHKSVAVPGALVKKSAKRLAAGLRKQHKDYKEYKVPAAELYQWLIAPITTLLQRHQINTLVFVPDGALRLVPLATLYDGEHYLIENYAVATSPGLTLFDPKPLSRQNANMLVAGLSVPGPGIKTLPDRYLQAILNVVGKKSYSQDRSENDRRDLARNIFGRGSVDGTKQPSVDPDMRNLLNQPEIYASVQSLLSLPGVKKEVDKLSQLFPGTTLHNETFKLSRVRQEIDQSSPYNVVHVASHGVFGSSSAESFILAHDQIITIDQLEVLLNSERLKNNPIELLTLSACQTAEGDDRSPLGISGIALRSKVRSVLGTLWSVNDAATLAFMERFYRELQDPDISKARAIQLAQQQLMKIDKYKHPFFWSPFLLIGNWL